MQKSKSICILNSVLNKFRSKYCSKGFFVRNYIIVLTVLLAQLVFSQSETNSRAQIAKYYAATSDSTRINLALNIGRQFVFSEPDSTIFFANEALRIAEAIHDKKNMGNSLHLIGTAYTLKDNYSTGLQYILRALKLREEIDDREGMAASLVTAGNIYKNEADYPEALRNFEQAVKIFSDLHDPVNTAIAGSCIGNVYTEEEKFAKALDYMLPAWDKIKNTNNAYAKANILLNTAIVYNHLDSLDKGREYSLNALSISKQIGYEEGIAGAKIELAKVARKTGHKAEAIKLASDALEIAKDIEENTTINKAALLLYETYKELHDYKNALASLELANNANDSLLNLDKRESINQLKYKFELDKQQSKIVLLRQQERTNTIILFAVLIIAIILFGLAVMLYRWHHKEKALNKALSAYAKEIQSKNEELARQTTFIKQQNDEISEKNQKLIMQNNELQSLDEQKNKILGMVAHDLRSPLSTILSSAEIVGMEIESAGSEEAMKFLGIIENVGSASLNLVNDLLDLAKIASGKLELFPVTQNYYDLIDEVISYTIIRASRKNIFISVEKEEGLGEFAFDRNRINQVLNNLLDNAIKYSQAETTISLFITREDNSVVTSVSDQGMGIPESETIKLFKEFSVTSVRSTGNEKSSGLGLAICKKIIETHGGAISVRSQQGKGSTFTFTLPMGISE